MKTVIIGLGNQGKKRYKSVGKDCAATVDPINKDADYKTIKDVQSAFMILQLFLYKKIIN